MDISDDKPIGDDIHEIDDSPRLHKDFKFNIINGVVVDVYIFDDGVWKSKSISGDGSETYQVDGNDVLRIKIESFGREIYRYSDSDGDGIFQRVSEQSIISPDGHGTVRKLGEPLRYSPTDDDDFIAVRGGDDAAGGLGSDSFVVREAAHLRIEDFHADEDDVLVFDTGLGISSREQLEAYITGTVFRDQEFIVYFGDDVSITLVGIQPGEISWSDVSVLS